MYIRCTDCKDVVVVHRQWIQCLWLVVGRRFIATNQSLMNHTLFRALTSATIEEYDH